MRATTQAASGNAATDRTSCRTPSTPLLQLKIRAGFLSLCLALPTAPILLAQDKTPEVTPHYLAFHSANVDMQPTLASLFDTKLDLQFEPSDAVVRFLEESPELTSRLGLNVSDFQLRAVLRQKDDDQIIINAMQLHDGVLIEQGILQLKFEASFGRLLSIGFLDLLDRSFAPSIPKISSETAIATATSSYANPEVYDKPALLFTPAGDRRDMILAWQVLAGNGKEDLFPMSYLINAEDGSILRQLPAAAGFEATGTVRGYSTPVASRLPDYPGNPPQSQTVPKLKVTLSPSESGYTNATGDYSITTSSPNPTVTATVNQGGTVNEGTFILRFEDNPLASVQNQGLTNIQLVLNSDPNNPNRKRYTAQLNCWQYAVLCRNFLDLIYGRTHTPFEALFYDCLRDLPEPRSKRSLAFMTNVPNSSCSTAIIGQYNDATVGCPPNIYIGTETHFTVNPAYASIICHEYGHYFVLEMTSLPLNKDGMNQNHHQGVADAVASYALEDPVMGRGLQKGPDGNPVTTSFYRNIETGVSCIDHCQTTWAYDSNSYVWPGSSLFSAPIVYAGAWWDLRKKLIQDFPATGKQTAEDLLIKYYESLFNIPLPDITYAIAMTDLLTVDDTFYFGGDNCVNNGTPHKAEIEYAFVRRNLYLKRFRRGDANGDGTVNVSDPSFILNYRFHGGPTPSCLDAADSNDDRFVDITDAIYLFDYLFNQGPAPPYPGPYTCGMEQTWEDGLTCIGQTVCPDEFPPCT